MADRGNQDSQVVDIDQMAGTLTRILEDVPNYMSIPGHPGRICRIPKTLREIDARAYEPYILSIGPYHHGKLAVQPMESRKRLGLKCVLEKRPELTLNYYLNEINNIVQTAETFYSDVEMETGEFVQMLLLDSLFLVTTFCGMPQKEIRMNHADHIPESRVENEDINRMVNMTHQGIGYAGDNACTQLIETEAAVLDEICSEQNNEARMFSIMFEHDLLLLENQLPFFVLEKVYALIYGGSGRQLVDIMTESIAILLSGYTKLESDMVTLRKGEVHHLLHLCHMFFRPTLQREPTAAGLPESSQIFRLGNVVQLYEAGVSFEARSGSSEHSLLDIAFDSSGKMIMPCLHVEDNTNSLLRNLIALEQMKYPNLGLNVSAYAVLLLHLVTVPEDVKLLRRKGIIEHHLASDKEMMRLINSLSIGLSFDYVEDNYSLKPVFRELKVYTERRRPRWKAWLKHRYFNNPWTVISLLAASILLLLSVIQTFYTVYSYY